MGPRVFWRKCICKNKTDNRCSKSLMRTSSKRNGMVNVCEKRNAFVNYGYMCKPGFV